MAKSYKFTAEIHAVGGGGAYILFPYDVEKEFGVKGRVPVNVTFDGVPYRGSLMKYGHPQHMIGILKDIQKKIGKDPGDTVSVVLTRDEEERKVEAPKELVQAMKKAKVDGFFAKLSYTHQKEYCKWITEAKREETRLSRIDRAVEMLKKSVKTPQG